MMVMMTKMLYLHFLHFLYNILNSTKSQSDGLNRNQEALPDHLIVDEAKLNKIQKLNYNASKPLFLPLLVHSSGSSVSFSFSS